MKCQVCGGNALTHVTDIEGNKSTTTHLCAVHAPDFMRHNTKAGTHTATMLCLSVKQSQLDAGKPVCVRLPNGEKTRLKLHPEVQDGCRLYIRGRADGAEDLCVHVRVVQDGDAVQE